MEISPLRRARSLACRRARRRPRGWRSSLARTPVVVAADPWPRDRPLVSVVVVCFNYGAYVEEAIASVLSQTAVEHCEVIVVDGGSTDPETVQTMRRLAADPPPRTRVFLRRMDGTSSATTATLGSSTPAAAT